MRTILMLSALVAGTVQTVAAQRADSAAFLIRLGTDTTAIERYVRTPNQLVAEAVQRSPTTSLHRLTISFGADGRVTGGEWTMRAPGAAQPQTRRVIRFQGDSAIIETTQGGTTSTRRTLAANAIPMAGPFYSPYELAIMRAVANGATRGTASLLPAATPVQIRVERVGSDSVTLNNQFDEPMRAHIDSRGRLLHLRTPAYTTVERLRWIDLDRLARDFATRDEMGKSMGQLSPRFTARRRVQNANIWLDYGRPAMRGRPVWGALVPWGQVWRMGANDAAHLATDRTLQIGDLTLQPGTYTLFLLPNPAGWQLIVNRATGMSGLEHDAAQDIGRVALRTSQLDRPVEWFTVDATEGQGGAVLSVSWDRTTATVPITVK